MLKRKIDHYIKRYYETTRNALLITGARQIGKTYSIRQFGKSFKSFIEINFIDNPEAVDVFKGAKGSADILFRLSAMTTIPLIKGETLIFFDEVQKCPEMVTAIKFLVDEGSYRYILSGSLLGVELKDLRSEPVGYMGIKDMYPLDFEEFISCVGINDKIIDSLRNAWESRVAVDEFVHSKIMELFRLYLVVGGMPAAVSKYIESNNLQAVMAVQQDIIRLYKRDIAQYDPDNKLYIEEIFNLKIPLLLARSRNLFKLFQNDIGLLAAQYAEGIQLRIIRGEKNINFGSVYENAVAQELVAHGIEPYYYNNKKRGELDFVIELDGKVLPIEVKSGKDYEVHRALSNIMDCKEYDLFEAVVFCNDNLRVEGKLVYAPVYMVMFLEKNNVAPTYYKVDLSMLQ